MIYPPLDWHINTNEVKNGFDLVNCLGHIPEFLTEADPRPAAEQIAERYVGGWNPYTDKWQMTADHVLLYPGDPPFQPVAFAHLRNEVILVYRHAIVAILQANGDFQVDRLD